MTTRLSYTESPSWVVPESTRPFAESITSTWYHREPYPGPNGDLFYRGAAVTGDFATPVIPGYSSLETQSAPNRPALQAPVNLNSDTARLRRVRFNVPYDDSDSSRSSIESNADRFTESANSSSALLSYGSLPSHGGRESSSPLSPSSDLGNVDYQYIVGSGSAAVRGTTSGGSNLKWIFGPKGMPLGQLNPLLCGGANQQDILMFDLSLSVFKPLYAESPGGTTTNTIPPMVLYQPATIPARSHMSISIDTSPYSVIPFPWTIYLSPSTSSLSSGEQVASKSAFVTVYDVLHAVHQALHRQIRHAHWGAVSKQQRRDIEHAYGKRLEREKEASSDPEDAPMQLGVKWVDYLLDDCMFKGLQPELDATRGSSSRSMRLVVGKYTNYFE